jgi:hypothetical protein
MIGEKGGHPANLQRMDHDVIHHLHFAHHPVALHFRWNLVVHRSIIPAFQKYVSRYGRLA